MDRRIVFLLPALVFGGLESYSATKYFDPVDSTTANVGEWNKNCAAVIETAKAENAPIVAVASQFGCAYCAALYTSVLNTQKFIDWCSSKPWYFMYAYSGTGNWGGTHPAYEVLNLGAMPRVTGYWKKRDGTIVGGINSTFAGRDSKATYEYITTFFEKLFADYSPNAADEWDHGDDVESGATVLTPTAVDQVHGLHTLSAEADTPDEADWFKMTVVADKRYRLGVSEWSISDGGIDVVVSYGDATKTCSLQEFAADDMLIKGYAGEVKICFRTTGTTSAGTYKLVYREFEEAVFSFEKSETSVMEDAGSLEFKVLRTGRLTDTVQATLNTADGSAVSGVNYTALADRVVAFRPDETEQIVKIAVKDIEGAQGDKTFSVKLTGEDTVGEPMLAVTIVDLDKTTDAFDPGDDTVGGATVLAMGDSVAELEEKRALSQIDRSDWYNFGTIVSGETYQVKVVDYTARPKNSPAPAAYFYIDGVLTGVDALSLDTLKNRFVAPSDGVLTLNVTNESDSASQGVYGYRLAWQHWVLPRVSLGEETLVATSGVNKAVILTRDLNLEESVAVPVRVVSSDPRVSTATNDVFFAAGAGSSEFTVRIFGDNGFWAPDETVTIEILDIGEGKTYQLGSGVSQTMTLKTAMPEFDEYDYNHTLSDPQKRRTTIKATLNGSNNADYYTFNVTGGVEYVFSVNDLASDQAFATDSVVQVSMQLPGATKVVIPNEECIGVSYHFTPASDGIATLFVDKQAGAPASLKYGLTYREWVPATVGLTVDSITVSEFASSARIGVRCEMEVPIDVSVNVITEDGTAKAGEDYLAISETISWNESSPVSSVKYVNVPLLKLTREYEGVSEMFKVKLDFSGSDAIEGPITESVVTILESDVGSAGTFTIDSYTTSAGTFPYQSRSIGIDEGETVIVNLKRVSGNAGEVVATLTWNDGVVADSVTFGDLETEKSVAVTMPASLGRYIAKTSKQLKLSTNLKAAKLSRSVLNFMIADRDLTLVDYRADKGHIPFSSSANAYYVDSVAGSIRCKSMSMGGSAELIVTLKGTGVLAFRPTVHGSGVVTVKVGAKASAEVNPAELAQVEIPVGSQRIVIGFLASSADSWLEITDESWTPSSGFYTNGVFNGAGVLAGVDATATFTVSSAGKVNGRLSGCDRYNYSFSGTLVEGVKIRRGAIVLPSDDTVIHLDIDPATGGWRMYDDDGVLVNVEGTRSGWSDKPLTGFELANQDIPGMELDPITLENGGTLVIKVSATGVARMAGKMVKVVNDRVTTRAVTQTQTVFFGGDDKVPMVMYLDTLNERGYLIELK